MIMVLMITGMKTVVAAEGAVQWDQGVVQASGMGVSPATADSQAQASLMARRAAIVDAYRNLAEAIGSVRVKADTTVQNFAVTDDTVKTKISALIHGARIVSEQPLSDGSYKVVLEVNLFGSDSVAQAIYAGRQDKPEPLPQPSTDYKPARLPAYTGVVVDARGLGLERVMSPRIYDDAGRIIYGDKYIDPDFVVSHGMVDYAATPDMMRSLEAGTTRAGASPIVVKAIGLKHFNSDVIISREDADRILAANAGNNFLARTAVVFEQ